MNGDEIVFKYTTAGQAFKAGLFGIGMGLVLLLRYLGRDGPLPGLPSWVSVVYLFIVIFVLGAGLIALFSTSWITITINKTQDILRIVRKGLISTHQTFPVTDVASVALHRIWRPYVTLREIHDQQLCIVLRDGVRIPLKNEVGENPDAVKTDVSLGMGAAQFMNVPFERTGPS